MDCGSKASALADFKRISDLCGWASEDAEALYSVRDQLASSKKASLLILDNCDDSATDYGRYIPSAAKVCVILTTRLSNAKRYATGDPQDASSRLSFQLKGLDTASAVNLMLDASDTQERNQQLEHQAREIATALDFHPLAIIVASSLIRSAVYYSLKDYADALRKRLAQKQLLDTASEQARYGKVSTTLEVSAESLRRLASTDTSAEAALALLDVLAFMHHQDVSEEMFVRAWKYEESALSRYGVDEGDEDGDIRHLTAWHVTRCRAVFCYLPVDERTQLFRKARAHLERLSLVSVNRAQRSMSLHSIVHVWARERVSDPGKTWAAAASILALSAEGRSDWQSFTSRLVRHHETSFATWQDVRRPVPDL